MSDSTKMLLAKALRELMHKRPLSRITVGDICSLCDMNRKSFYYHFHDKFELVNWIFRRDLKEALDAGAQQDELYALCCCLRADVGFYRTALQQMEQNPLCLCMDELLRPMMAARMASGAAPEDPLAAEMCVHAVRSVIVRWVRSGCMQTEKEFVRTLYHACVQLGRMPVRG